MQKENKEMTNTKEVAEMIIGMTFLYLRSQILQNVHVYKCKILVMTPLCIKPE